MTHQGDQQLLLSSHDGLQKLNIDLLTVQTIITEEIITGTTGNLSVTGDITASGEICADLQLTVRDTVNDFKVGLSAPVLGADLSLKLPAVDGGLNSAIVTDGAGNLSFSALGVGDVSGPVLSITDTIARFDGISGKLLDDSGVVLNDTDDISSINSLSLNLANNNWTAGTINTSVGVSSQALSAEINININESGRMRWQGTTSGNRVSIRANDSTTTFELQLPTSPASNIDDLLVQENLISGQLAFKSPAVLDILGNVESSIDFANDNRLMRSDSVIPSKNVQQSTVSLDDSGNLTGVTSINTADPADFVQSSSNFGTDDRLLKTDGTFRNIQRSNISLDDFDSLAGINGLATGGDQQLLLQTSSTTSDAIRLNASGFAGGIDIDATTIDINANGITETSILLNSTGGGIDLEAGSGHTLELDGGQVKIKNKDNTAKAIELITDQGVSETIELICTQGTSDGAIKLESLAGGVSIVSNVISANAIHIDTSAESMATLKLSSGSLVNVDINGVLINANQGLSNIDSLFTSGATGQIFLQSTLNVSNAVGLNATIGGISLLSGTKCEVQSNQADVAAVDINTPFGGILLSALIAGSADAIKLSASNATSGVLIESGSSGVVDLNGIKFDSSREITEINKLSFLEIGGAQSITFQAPSVVPSNYQIQWPSEKGVPNQVLSIGGVVTDLMVMQFSDQVLPLGFIHGFEFQYSSVSSIDIGTTGEDSQCRISNGTGTLSYSGITNVSILTDLSSTYTEAANTSYDVYAIADSFTPSSEDYLIIEADDDIESVAEFSVSFDVYRRVAWFRNGAGSSIIQFITQGKGNERAYFFNTDRTDVIVLSDGNSSTFVDIDLSNFMGLDSRTAVLRGAFGDLGGTTVANATAALRTNGSSSIIEECIVTISPGNALTTSALVDAQVTIMTDTAQIIEYALTNAGDSLFLYQWGFAFGL